MHSRSYYADGLSTPLVLLVVLVILGVAGGVYYASTQSQPVATVSPTPVVAQQRTVPTTSGVPAAVQSVAPTFQGAVLAGTSAKLLDFTKADYDAALASDKLVVLYFYASWCPECRIEFPLMQGAFNQLTNDKVIGFRVNFNDTDTDDIEKGLAREYGIAYQHTKVFVKNGQRILKSPEVWSQERYIAEIQANQ